MWKVYTPIPSCHRTNGGMTMKKYEELKLDILYLQNADIITYSNGKDNDGEDQENWFDD